jgi:competence protein ComEC
MFFNEIQEQIKNKFKTVVFDDRYIKQLSAGDTIFIDKNTKIMVLFPEVFFKSGSLDSNESSLVLKIQHKNKTFLITGDLPFKFEKYLVKKYGKELKADVLLAGHHGSKTSSSLDFLKVVDPEYFVVSVGEDNSYNLPSNEVLDRVRKFGIKILRTDLSGNVIFNIKDSDLILKQEK